MRGASACRGCGADHHTGWNQAATDYDGLDLPGGEPEFDYDEFMRREFGREGRTMLFAGLKPIWWFTALALLVAFLIAAFR